MHNKRRTPMNNGGGQHSGGGQHRHHNNRPRRFGSGRPSSGSGDDAANVSRTRRNATQSREKYQMMARDALSMGDRVLAENYLQHADHYYRVLLALPPEEVRQPYQQRSHAPADGQQAPSDTPESVSADNNDAPIHTTSHALPAFITQPVNLTEQDNPENL